FWLDLTPPKRRPQGHPLLGDHIELAAPQGTHCWQSEIAIDSKPFLAEHRVLGQVVMPAAGYLEMALTAAAKLGGKDAWSIEDVVFKEALIVSDKDSQTIQTIATTGMTGGWSFEISSRHASGWTTHATGTIRNHVEVSAEAPGTLDQLRSRCSETVDVADL